MPTEFLKFYVSLRNSKNIVCEVHKWKEFSNCDVANERINTIVRGDL